MRSACATAPEGSPPGPPASCATKVRSPAVAPTAKAGSSEASHRWAGAWGAAGAPCDALEESDALTQTAPVALPRKARRESRDRSSVSPELHISRVLRPLAPTFILREAPRRARPRKNGPGRVAQPRERSDRRLPVMMMAECGASAAIASLERLRRYARVAIVLGGLTAVAARSAGNAGGAQALNSLRTAIARMFSSAEVPELGTSRGTQSGQPES